MMSTVRRRRPDLGRSLTSLFTAVSAAVAGAACGDQSAESVSEQPPRAEIVAGQTVTQAGDTGAETRAFTTIGQAALQGDIEDVERQLSEGADINVLSDGGMTPLMLSFRPLILAPTTSGEDPDAFREFQARQARKLKIARLLLDRGADLTKTSDLGMTALHYLVLMYGEERTLLDTLKAFLEKGADPNVSNRDGLTPLMFAADGNRLESVKLLLSAGADPNATAKDGHTAMSIARERGHEGVAALLEQKLQQR